MRACILCGTMTTGSIGAAGLRWSALCQPCKDAEDGAASGRITAQITAFRLVESALGGIGDGAKQKRRNGRATR